MSEIKTFQRREEDFDCLVCGLHVHGNGYTNHCPRCLCSRHVDHHPGDRLCDCGGIMVPEGIDRKNNTYVIVQKCMRCGHKHRNKAAKEDSFEAICSLSAGSYPVYLEALLKNKS